MSIRRKPIAVTSAGLMTAALLAAGLAAPAAASSDVDGGTVFTGYTDKNALKADGRATVTAEELRVTDGSAPDGAGTSYYVDSEGGNDDADGLSPETAWASFAHVNGREFAPGDRILLRAGSVWSAEGDEIAAEAYDYTEWASGAPVDVDGPDATAILAPGGSGVEGAPIILSSYGDGPAPQLDGRGVVNDVVQLTNQEHWHISNLEISNVADGFDPTTFEPVEEYGQAPGQENPLTGDVRGIHVQAENAGTLRGYEITNTYIHDVSGVMWSVSRGGLDRSKRTGGILFEGLKGEAETASQFDGIEIRDNVIANTAFANIIFKQFSGMGTNRYQDVEPGWGDRAAATASATGEVTEDPDWRPHTDIVVADNYLTNRDTEYGWDSMYLTSVQAATVEGNVIDGAGVSGIELYYSDNVLIQDNEVAELATRVGAADSNGIDPDRGSTNALIQANYIHDSGEGILLCGFGFGSSVSRYNIIQDIDRNYVNPHGDRGVNVVHNNLMYNSVEPLKNNTVGFFESSGNAGSYLTERNPHYVLNNVFVNALESVTGAQFRGTDLGVTLQSNAYFGPGVEAPAADAHGVDTDPLLGGNPADGIENVIPVDGSSPLISAGTDVDLAEIAPGFAVTGASGVDQLPIPGDFFAEAPTTPPHIGPASYRPADGTGHLSGFVVDQAGDPVPNASVTVGGDTVTADANGRFVFERAAGDYALVASADDYADGAPTPVTLESGATSFERIALGETLTTEGSVAGTVTSGGEAVGGASVTVSKDGVDVASAESQADGAFRIDGLEAGDGYTVTVSKDGYATAAQEGLTVRAARTATVDIVLSAEQGETHYAIDETFADEPVGAFAGTSDGVLAARGNAAVGTIEIVEDGSDGRALKIDKASRASGALAVFNTQELNLTGTVTLEARLKRTTTGTPDQTALYSFTENDWNASDTSASKNPAATIGYAGGKIISHNTRGSSSTVTAGSYAVGEWQVVRNVVDLDRGTFDFYIGDMSTPVLSDQPLRTAIDDLDYINLFTNGTNAGDLFVDYVRVNTGAPYDFDDAGLAAVSADGSELAATGGIFAGEVPAFADSVRIAPVASSGFASITVDGAPYTGEPIAVALAEGGADNSTIVTRIPVVVTAEDGTTMTHTVEISRTNPNQLAQLAALTATGFELDPVFEPSRSGSDNPYAIDAGGADEVQLAWDLGWDGRLVQVDGRELPAGSTGTTIALDAPETVVTLTVSSHTGDFGTYVLVITRDEPDAPEPVVDVTTSPRCLPSKLVLTVTATNTTDRRADITVSSEFGDRTFKNTKPGKSASVGFDVRERSIEAGEIDVTIAFDDGTVEHRTVAYDAHGCE